MGAVFGRALTSLVAAAAVGLPMVETAAAARARTATTVSKTVKGSLATAGRWGYVQLTVTYTKTTTTRNGKRHVAIKITHVTAPIYPNHTDRSNYISSQALPLLEQEVLQLQPSSSLSTFRLVTGATDTSYSFAESLHAALLAIGK